MGWEQLESPGRAAEVFGEGVPCPGTFTFETMFKHQAGQTIHLVSRVNVAHGPPV